MHPVCLIRQGNEGLEVVDEGVAYVAFDRGYMVDGVVYRLLKSLELEPLAVICLAGQYRTGKSFFLNQMCRNREQEGFVVGPTTESCTRGIWIWDADIRNAQRQKILLMDTEGIASTDNDESYDAKIFSLGLLLSSLFVFNTMGVIDEGAIDRLFLVSELTKHVYIQHNSSKNASLAEEDDLVDGPTETELAPHFPPFVWLLRDFLLDMQENGNILTPTAYLERSLEPRDGTSRRMEERNRIRQSIRTLFTQRECLTLVRPATDEEKLRNASLLTDDDLRPEFVTQMQAIRTRLYELARPKLVLGQVVDGPKLLYLIKSYIETMNSGAVPDIKAAWEYVSDATCETAAKRALEEYHNVMATNTSMAQADFEQIYKEAQDKALITYKKISVEGEARKRCFQTLKTAIASDRTAQIATLQEKSKSFCTTLLLRLLHETIMSPIENGEWDNDTEIPLANRLESLLTSYEAEALGPAKNKALLTFLQTDMLKAFDCFIQRREKHHTLMLQSSVAVAEANEKAFEEAKRNLENEIHALQLEQVRLNGAADLLNDKLSTATATITELRDSKSSLTSQLEASNASLQQLRSEYDSLQKDNVAVTLEKNQLSMRLEQTCVELNEVQVERDQIQSNLSQELQNERRDRTGERERAITDMAKLAGELHAAQRALKTAATESEELMHTNLLQTKEKEMLQHKLEFATAKSFECRNQLTNLTNEHSQAANLLQRYQKRNERLETQLGELGIAQQVELVVEQCCWTIVKQAEMDKAIQLLLEEKAVLIERLGELHLKISSLPDFYQRQVFCTDEATPDFFDALTAFIGQ
ncbi:guanylate-binding protein [Thraustotheca clavata]|uniref:Guanylate-binding protein n=1 Tax=Thraustotheca clavata TaxID=74557 RepID=A0A1W0A8X3_9STRA|nr:guanylate-binding protein [Thraustotheca clavata]